MLYMQFPVWFSALVHTDSQSNTLTPSICSIVTSLMVVSYICGCKLLMILVMLLTKHITCLCSSKFAVAWFNHHTCGCHAGILCLCILYRCNYIIAVKPHCMQWDRSHYLTCASVNRPFLQGLCTCASLLRVSVGQMTIYTYPGNLVLCGTLSDTQAAMEGISWIDIFIDLWINLMSSRAVMYSTTLQGTLSDKQASAMQVLLQIQRKEFHQHRINLMGSRAVMYQLTHI